MVSRFPPTNLRIKTEDLINKSASSGLSSEVSVISSKIASQSEIEDNTFEQQMDDLQKNVEIRNKQFEESKNFADKNEDDDDEEDEEEEQA